MDDFLRRMTEVGQKMKSLGWITGTKSNRQDAWYNWTSKGKALFPSFMSEMRKLADVFNAQDVEFIRQHGFYLGIKTKSKKEVSSKICAYLRPCRKRGLGGRVT